MAKNKKMTMRVAAVFLALLTTLTVALPLNAFAEEVSTPPQETVENELTATDDPVVITTEGGPTGGDPNEGGPTEGDPNEGGPTEGDTTEGGPFGDVVEEEPSDDDTTQAQTYTVVFYDADGGIFDELQAEENSLLARPDTDPAAPEGQIFDGWRAENETENFDFDNTTVTGELKLYPVFVDEPASEPEVPVVGEEPPQNTTEEEEEEPESDSLISGQSLLLDVSEDEYLVTFMVGESVDQTQAVDKDSLIAWYQPTDPDGATFLGWFDEDGNYFGQYTLVTRNITLTARFSDDEVLVTYLDSNLANELRVDVVAKGTLLEQSHLDEVAESVSAVSGKAFSAWGVYTGSATLGSFDATQSIEDNIVLAPVMNNLNMAVFITNGTIIDPQVVQQGTYAKEPENDPTRSGYTFTGWYEDADTTTQFDFEATPIEGTVFIYAGWEADKVNYMVNFWAEKAGVSGSPDPQADAASYELVYTAEVEKGATAGDTVTYTAGEANALYAAESTAGRLNESANNILNYSDLVFSEEKEVSGSGNTVINVYYNRFLFTFSFDLSGVYNTSGGKVSSTVESITINGVAHPASDYGAAYTIQYKYEQDISAIWPQDIKLSGNYLFTNWSGFFGNNAVSAGFNQVNVPFGTGSKSPMASPWNYAPGRYGNKSNSARVYAIGPTYAETRYYYVEVTDEDTLAKLASGELSSINANATSIVGVTSGYVKWTAGDGAYKGTSYYEFVRSSDFNAQSGWSPTNWPGTSIEGYVTIGTGLTPYLQKADLIGKPDNAPKGYYQLSYFMPAVKYSVTLVTNGGSIDQAALDEMGYTQSGSNYTLSRTYGQALTVPGSGSLSKDRATFQGWYLDENFNEAYVPGGTMPAKNITLYARFDGTDFSVTYNDGKGDTLKTATYSDGEDYRGADKDLAGTDYAAWTKGATVEGYGIFNGWYYTVGTGQSTYSVAFPTDTPITANIVLTASWTPVTYTVSFYDTYDSQPDKGTYSVLSTTNTMSQSRNTMPTATAEIDGWVFKGWSTGSSGTATVNFKGNTAVEGDTNVYAVRELKDVTLTYDLNSEGAAFSPPGTPSVVIVKYGNSLSDEGHALYACPAPESPPSATAMFLPGGPPRQAAARSLLAPKS